MLSISLTDRVTAAQQRGARLRPRVAGFPHLAQSLREAGVRAVRCVVPAATTVYRTDDGSLVDQGTPLVTGATEVPPFDVEALVAALRRDQCGESTYPEFVASAWRAGVVSYDVDLDARTCTYVGAHGESYVEDYPAVVLADS
jgi:uncharacterized protein YbcV (DUF1398 family)